MIVRLRNQHRVAVAEETVFLLHRFGVRPFHQFVTTQRPDQNEQRAAWQTVVDVWEGEPVPNQALLQQVDLATPHIAGHSVQAKLRGSRMVYHSFLEHFFGEEIAAKDCSPVETSVADAAPFVTLTEHSSLNDAVLAAYDVRDDVRLLTALAENNTNIGEEFERLRKQYRVRHEFSTCRFKHDKSLDSNLINNLKYLKFNV